MPGFAKVITRITCQKRREETENKQVKKIYHLDDNTAYTLFDELKQSARLHISTSQTDKLFDSFHNIATFTVMADGIQVELMRG